MPVLCASDFQSRSGQLRHLQLLSADQRNSLFECFVRVAVSSSRSRLGSNCMSKESRWSVCSSVPVCRSLVSHAHVRLHVSLATAFAALHVAISASAEIGTQSRLARRLRLRLRRCLYVHRSTHRNKFIARTSMYILLIL